MKTIMNALMAFAVVAFVLAHEAPAQVSDKEVTQLQFLRTGNGNTVPFAGFADVEAEGQRLLQKYKDPESQGRIYWHLATIYGASGSEFSAKTIEYAQKALAQALPPHARLQMYCDWGDSIQTMHAGVKGAELAVVRREAVMPYLQGLRESLKYNLPDDPPEFPKEASNAGFLVIGDPLLLEETQRKESARKKRMHDYLEQRESVKGREILIGQIVFMYSRKPFATDEIRGLAAQVIGDDHLVGRLMTAVEETINERVTTGGGGTPYLSKVIPKFQEPPPAQEVAPNTAKPATAATAKP